MAVAAVAVVAVVDGGAVAAAEFVLAGREEEVVGGGGAAAGEGGAVVVMEGEGVGDGLAGGELAALDQEAELRHDLALRYAFPQHDEHNA